MWTQSPAPRARARHVHLAPGVISGLNNGQFYVGVDVIGIEVDVIGVGVDVIGVGVDVIGGVQRSEVYSRSGSQSLRANWCYYCVSARLRSIRLSPTTRRHPTERRSASDWSAARIHPRFLRLIGPP
eukprot:980347-Prorocentrum_minimum.AAC.1